MEQVLYGDVLFFVNFTMDFLTLFVTAQILHRKIRPIRLTASAAIGAIYGVAACFMSSMLIFQIIINIAVSFLMCYVAYEKKILPCCALFYGTGCLLGGVMTVVYGMLNSLSGTKTVYVNGQYQAISNDIPLGWMLVVAAITGVAAILGGRYEKRKRGAVDVSFTVVSEKGSKSFLGICDSGNFLTDPISGKPVIIMTKKAILSILPEEMKDVFESENTSLLPSLPPEYIRKTRLIPSVSVGGESMLMGFVPDGVIFDGNEKSAILALCRESDGFDGREALIPSVLCDR